MGLGDIDAYLTREPEPEPYDGETVCPECGATGRTHDEYCPEQAGCPDCQTIGGHTPACHAARKADDSCNDEEDPTHEWEKREASDG